MAKADLDDLRAQIDWAESQFQVIERGIQAFSQSEPYRTFVDVDSETGEQRLQVVATKIVPRDLRACTGAAIGALRSSLDHLAVALAKRNGAEKTRDVYFPISRDEKTFLDDGLKKLKRLSSADIAAIRNIKPYGGGQELLVALHSVNTGHKHSNLVALGGLSSSVGIHELSASNVSIYTGQRLEHGVPATIMKGTFAPNYRISVGIEIAFSDCSAIHGKAVPIVLREFHALTKSIVEMFHN